MTRRLSRRSLLVGAGAVGAVGAAGAVAVAATSSASTSTGAPDSTAQVVEFTGEHQAGIVTPAQDRLHLAVFDVVTDDRDALAEMLREWTAAAARMTRGLDAAPGGSVGGSPLAAPADTGEALGLSPAHLTLTVGFGPSLFRDARGRDRFGLAGIFPAALAPLPPFRGDRLEPARSGGDIVVQACADDPQIAVHAVRNLARLARGVAVVRWSQLGFGRTSSTSTSQTTPRNLFGFKDGTANPRAEDADVLREHVWVQPGDGPAWMAGGSYLVARRVEMIIETWDRTSLQEQEQVIGRDKAAGAPLSGGSEFDAPDFSRTADDGAPAIPTTAHVRLAHPTQNDGATMLRRGYSFVDGSDDLGRLTAGLMFLAYMRDPRTAFVPVQQRLASGDALNEYIRHTGSAVFACPPGVTDDVDWWGRTLFEA